MSSVAGEHFDVVVIGSGFGGSVTALRLVEKGYTVAVLEAGRPLAFLSGRTPLASFALGDFRMSSGEPELIDSDSWCPRVLPSGCSMERYGR